MILFFIFYLNTFISNFRQDGSIKVETNGIEVKNLTKVYGTLKAVDNVTFSVPKGTLYSLLGPNGAGKTTTLNILSCNLLPTEGEADINGYSVVDRSNEVKKYIGVCPQENVLYNHLTVLENISFFGKMHEMSSKEIKESAAFLIEKVGLVDKMNVKVDKLSGGQKRRVNLLVGLIHKPDVLFLDEPTSGLDPQTRRMIWDYILELKNQGITIILTTHYMDEADILSDRVGIIDHGKIIAEDTPEELKASIGKGDNLIFKLNGSPSEITKILQQFIEKKDIVSFSQTEDELSSYRVVSLDGISKIGKMVNVFAENRIQVEDIAIHANSLENVFLSLTGRQLRE